MTRKTPPTLSFPEVTFSDQGDMRFLHLGTPWVQGMMSIKQPFDLKLEYAERMMAWLLFVTVPSVPKRHAMQLGLGAASLTKFCHNKLRMRTTVIELNPQVVLACRTWFKLPSEDKRLKVVVADAGQEIRRPVWHRTVDALQVDLYDEEADGPVLDSEDFYRDCHRLLTDDGCMTVNLFGRLSSYDESLRKIVKVFGPGTVWTFKPTKEGNSIVLAQRTARPPSMDQLVARCQDIQQRWKIRTSTWLHMFNPLPP